MLFDTLWSHFAKENDPKYTEILAPTNSGAIPTVERFGGNPRTERFGAGNKQGIPIQHGTNEPMCRGEVFIGLSYWLHDLNLRNTILSQSFRF